MASKATSTPVTRQRVALPDAVASTEAEWPGSKRGSTASPLRTQIMEDLQSMEHGSVRRYELAGAKEQAKFVSLFRKCVDEVFVTTEGDPAYGVQTVLQDDAVFVKIGDRRQAS